MIKDLIEQNGEWSFYEKAFLQSNRQKKESYRIEHKLKVEQFENKYFNKTYYCPECRAEMFDLGMDIRVPKLGKSKEWKILKDMYKIGHAFQTCGCDGPGFIPKNRVDYKDYLINKKETYEQVLEYKSQRQPNHSERIYWKEKIKKIETILNEL
ncbi:MAG: hypothetical protein JXQ87_07030 [Bacteroidia bacterium]